MGINYIIKAPFQVWFAPEGYPQPEVDTEPLGSWRQFGSFGRADQSEAGVKVMVKPSREKIIGGATIARDLILKEQSVSVEFELMEITLKNLAMAIGQRPVSVIPATTTNPAYEEMALTSDEDSPRIALLVRGRSPYTSLKSRKVQWWLPSAAFMSDQELQFSKTKETYVKYVYEGLYYPGATGEETALGTIRAYTGERLGS